MNALPSYLQKDIQNYLATSMLQGLDLFDALPPSIVGQIALKLKSKSCNIGQKPFIIGDIGKSLYIQRTGKSRLYFTNSTQYKVLRRGDVCGEHALLSCKRVNTLLCMTWSEFYTLNVDDIESVLRENLDEKTAEIEWNRIKNTVRASDMRVSTVETGKLLTETRHVQFGSNYFKDAFSTFVERDVVDELSAIGAPSETPKGAQIAGDLWTPKGSGTPRATPRRKGHRKRYPTFKALQNMFNRSSSAMRDEKVINLHQRDEHTGYQNANMMLYSSPPSKYHSQQQQLGSLHPAEIGMEIIGRKHNEEEINDDDNDDGDTLKRHGTNETFNMTDDECIVLTMKSSTGYGAIPPILTPLSTIQSELNHTP